MNSKLIIQNSEFVHRIVSGSGSIDGVNVRVMSEAQFLACEDAKGALIVLEPETQLEQKVLQAMQDREAIGFVTDFTPERFERPDEVPEVVPQYPMNGLAGFAITPRAAVHLRTLAAAGGLRASVFCDNAGNGEVSYPPKRPSRAIGPDLAKKDILASLKAVGVKKGDILLVHSSLSACGTIEGGAETVIDSLLEAVGEEGTIVMPAFRRSSAFLNGIGKRWETRPSRADDNGSVAMRSFIGAIPATFLAKHPEVVRGRHASHPWCALGPMAKAMTCEQEENEPPASDNSTLAKAVEYGAKILHFGSPLGHTTFLHYFEDHYNLPGLGPSLVAVQRPDGTNTWVYVPKNVPGPREFYSKNGDAKFFKMAVERGLAIADESLGAGHLLLIDCRQLWQIGSDIVREYPRILIGD